MDELIDPAGRDVSERASAFWLSPIGRMNSSARISPGCGFGSRSSSVMVVDDPDIAVIPAECTCRRGTTKRVTDKPNMARGLATRRHAESSNPSPA
jgi:hypothetical protein